MCQAHGGKAPQVRNAAARRIAHLADPAIARLEKSLESKNEGVALRAAQDILDRNNMKGENIIRLMNPDAGGGQQQFKISEEQLARIEALSPDELAVLCRVLGFLETSERDRPVESTKGVVLQ